MSYFYLKTNEWQRYWAKGSLTLTVRFWSLTFSHVESPIWGLSLRKLSEEAHIFSLFSTIQEITRPVEKLWGPTIAAMTAHDIWIVKNTWKQWPTVRGFQPPRLSPSTRPIHLSESEFQVGPLQTLSALPDSKCIETVEVWYSLACKELKPCQLENW